MLKSISLREKSHVEKFGYTVKFQEAVQPSGAVSSTCLFLKVSSNLAIFEVRHKEVPEQYALLKLSFSFNSIQNPLQRYYRRGQTVIPFEQNVLEDTDEIKNKVFS